MLEEEAQSYEDCCEGEGDEEVVELGVVRSRLEVRPGDVGGKPDTGRPEHRAQAASHGALSETQETQTIKYISRQILIAFGRC